MSGVQAAYGSTPTAVPKNLDEITDEELLRQLWQEAENYSERRRIRSRMYKLREKRLREMVQNDEESLGTLATTDQGTYASEKSEAKIAVGNPPKKSANIEVNLQVRGDSAVTDSVSMHNVKLGGLTMRGIGYREAKRPSSDEEIIEEKVEETKKNRNDRFTNIMSMYEQNPSDDTIVSVSKLTYSVQNNALAGDSYQSMKHKEVRDSVSPTRYDNRRRITETNRNLFKNSAQDSSDESSKVTKKQTSSYGKVQKDSNKKNITRKLSKELNTSPIIGSRINEKNVRKQNTDKISTKVNVKPVRKPMVKETSSTNEYNKLDSYLHTCTDPNDELITEEEEVAEDESGNTVRTIVQTRRKKDGTEYMSRRIARTTKVVDNEKDINEILMGNPDHEVIDRNVEEKEESDGSKIKIISEVRRRPDGIEYQTRNILKTSKIFDYDHPENVSYSENDELIDIKEAKEIDENGVEILAITEIRRKATGEKYTTKKVYKTSKVTSEISPSPNDEVLERTETEEMSSDGGNVKVITERRKTQKGEEYTHRQVFKARKMTLSDIELLKGSKYLKPSLTSEDEIVNRQESDEIDQAGNTVRKVTELRKKKDGSQYSFDYVLRSVKGTESEIKDIPYKVCESSEINTSINDELIKEDTKEELQEDGSTVKTVIERRKASDGTHYLRHRVIRIPKLPEPELQVASKDDELLEKDINEDVLDDGTQCRAITERRRSSTTGIHYTLRRMSKVFHPTIHLFGVDEIIDENVTEEETSDGVLTRTVIRRYQRPDDSVYTTHNVSKTYTNPVQVMPDECSNDELVDRSYDVRETHDGFLIRTVMETRCRTDGVHYTVERTEKISKSKSGLKSSNAENDTLLTGCPGDTVISREQHEEPGDTGIIIKTVLEMRRRNNGTEYTNKTTVKTTQILVPQHETSYVIIKPDPKNANGKDFMPSLNDEIIYTRKKEEVDDKGNTINVVIETRKSSVTGEKYNLTKRVRTTDVVMTDHGEKVLSKTKQRGEEVNTGANLLSKSSNKQANKKYFHETNPTKGTNRNSPAKKVKGDVESSPKSTKSSFTAKNRITDSKITSSTTDDECKSESQMRKTVETKRSVITSNLVKEKNVKADSSTNRFSSKSRSTEMTATKNPKTIDDAVTKCNKVSMKYKSSGSSSETTSEGFSPDRSTANRNIAPLSKKNQLKSISSGEGNTQSTHKSTATEINSKTTTKEVKENLLKKGTSSSKEDNAKNVKRINVKSRSSEEDSSNETKQKESKENKSITGSKFEKKTTPREKNYLKSVSSTGTPHSVNTRASTTKRNSLPGENLQLTSRSTNEKAINYMNVIKKKNIKENSENLDTSDHSKIRSTNKTAAIREKYSKTPATNMNSTSKTIDRQKLDKSILSQIIPDTPKSNEGKKYEPLSVLRTSVNVTDGVSSKRSMFEKYSDIKTIHVNPISKERVPVVEPVIVPKYIAPLYKDAKDKSVDLSNMKSKDLKLASTKLVRDTMHPEIKQEHEDSPMREIQSDVSKYEFIEKHISAADDTTTTDYASEMKTKRLSTSSVDSFSYQRQDSGSSFVKESSPSRFVTGKPIDHGVNANKIKRLERAGSNKKILEDLEPASSATLPVTEKIDAISDLTELENMLNIAENYEERRLIRGRIRIVKRETQSQQSNRLEKSVVDKYSFKSPSNLSPQIQRRSAHLTGKSDNTTRKEERYNVNSTSTALSSSATKSVSSISKSFSESSKKESEIRKISSSSITSNEEKSDFERRKSSTSSISEVKRKSSADDTLEKSSKSVEDTKIDKKSTSNKFTDSKSKFELRSGKESSLERVKESIIEKTKASNDAKKQTYSEPLRHQKVKTEFTESHQTDVEKIISPYGVGPTDENGLPLFGLRALKRRNKPADIQLEEESRSFHRSTDTTGVTLKKKKVSIEEHQEETKFETDSLNMEPDSLSEAEEEEENVRSKNFRNIVKLHESKVTEPSPVAESSSPPKLKLRQDFMMQEEKAEQKSYKTWDLENDLVTRSAAVENIIAKHETLTTRESPRVEKRLTGILKKTSSLKSSKVTNEKESTGSDVNEESTKRYSSEISSDFCGTKDSGRKSSFAEVTLSSQPKASKKKKQRRLDNTRQLSETLRKKQEGLNESMAAISKKTQMNTSATDKKSASVIKTKARKSTKSLGNKEVYSDIKKSSMDYTEDLKLSEKNVRHRNVKNKSKFNDSNTAMTKTRRDKLDRREVKTTKQVVLEQMKSRSESLGTEEVYTASTTIRKSSLEKGIKKSKGSNINRSVIRNSSSQNAGAKGNKQIKKLSVSSDNKVIKVEKATKSGERKQTEIISIVRGIDLKNKHTESNATINTKIDNKKRKKVKQQELANSDKLVSNMQNKGVSQPSPKSERKRIKKGKKEYSAISNTDTEKIASNTDYLSKTDNLKVIKTKKLSTENKIKTIAKVSNLELCKTFKISTKDKAEAIPKNDNFKSIKCKKVSTQDTVESYSKVDKLNSDENKKMCMQNKVESFSKVDNLKSDKSETMSMQDKAKDITKAENFKSVKSDKMFIENKADHISKIGSLKIAKIEKLSTEDNMETISKIDNLKSVKTEKISTHDKIKELSKIDNIKSVKTEKNSIEDKAENISKIDNLKLFKTVKHSTEDNMETISKTDNLKSVGTKKNYTQDKEKSLSKTGNLKSVETDKTFIEDKTENTSRIDNLKLVNIEKHSTEDNTATISKINIRKSVRTEQISTQDKAKTLSKTDNLKSNKADKTSIEDKAENLSKINNLKLVNIEKLSTTKDNTETISKTDNLKSIKTEQISAKDKEESISKTDSFKSTKTKKLSTQDTAETISNRDNITSIKAKSLSTPKMTPSEGEAYTEKTITDSCSKKFDTINKIEQKKHVAESLLSEKQDVISTNTENRAASISVQLNHAKENNSINSNQLLDNETVAVSNICQVMTSVEVKDDKSQNKHNLGNTTDQTATLVCHSMMKVSDESKNDSNSVSRSSIENKVSRKKKNTVAKHLSLRNDNSSNRIELDTSKKLRNENNVIDSKMTSSYKTNNEEKVVKKFDTEKNTQKLILKDQQAKGEKHDIVTSQNSKFVSNSKASKVNKITKDSVSVEKVPLAKADIRMASSQEIVKSSTKEMPNYMRPRSTNRRRSVPEKEPEELENILLNSYIYTRCTKKISLPPVSYDYTYVINNESKTAGTNGDSYSVYFGPRDQAPLAHGSKRSSIVSDTFSVGEDNLFTDHAVDAFRKTSDQNINSTLDIYSPERRSSVVSERSALDESNNVEIKENFLQTVANTDMQSSESYKEIMHEAEISSHNLEISNICSRHDAHLAVPEVNATRFDHVLSKDSGKHLSSTEKDLQNKYYYQVERKSTENIGSLENQKKDLTLSSSDAEKSVAVADKFNVDFTKVYADKMAKYYNSSVKDEDQTSNVSDMQVKMQSEQKSESYHYDSKRTETNEQSDSYCFTFDGRPVAPKPLSHHLDESSSQNPMATMYPPQSKEIFERTSHNEELTSDREYSTKYEISTEANIQRESEMADEKSFLNDRTKVTGISDVLTRMGATEAVDHEAKVSSDDQARSLLNRFIGAQVLMTGVESMMAQSAPSQNRSPAAFGQGKPTAISSNVKSTSTVQQSAPDIVQGVNINGDIDSFELNELLDSCEGYDDRRRIRLRLKDVVAQEKASGDIIGLKKVTSTTRRIVGSKVATVGSSEEIMDQKKSKLKYTDFIVPPLPTSAHKIAQRESCSSPLSPTPSVTHSTGACSDKDFRDNQESDKLGKVSDTWISATKNPNIITSSKPWAKENNMTIKGEFVKKNKEKLINKNDTAIEILEDKININSVVSHKNTIDCKHSKEKYCKSDNKILKSNDNLSLEPKGLISRVKDISNKFKTISDSNKNTFKAKEIEPISDKSESTQFKFKLRKKDKSDVQSPSDGQKLAKPKSHKSERKNRISKICDSVFNNNINKNNIPTSVNNVQDSNKKQHKETIHSSPEITNQEKVTDYSGSIQNLKLPRNVGKEPSVTDSFIGPTINKLNKNNVAFKNITKQIENDKTNNINLSTPNTLEKKANEKLKQFDVWENNAQECSPVATSSSWKTSPSSPSFKSSPTSPAFKSSPTNPICKSSLTSQSFVKKNKNKLETEIGMPDNKPLERNSTSDEFKSVISNFEKKNVETNIKKDVEKVSSPVKINNTGVIRRHLTHFQEQANNTSATFPLMLSKSCTFRHSSFDPIINNNPPAQDISMIKRQKNRDSHSVKFSQIVENLECGEPKPTIDLSLSSKNKPNSRNRPKSLYSGSTDKKNSIVSQFSWNKAVGKLPLSNIKSEAKIIAEDKRKKIESYFKTSQPIPNKSYAIKQPNMRNKSNNSNRTRIKSNSSSERSSICDSWEHLVSNTDYNSQLLDEIFSETLLKDIELSDSSLSRRRFSDFSVDSNEGIPEVRVGSKLARSQTLGHMLYRESDRNVVPLNDATSAYNKVYSSIMKESSKGHCLGDHDKARMTLLKLATFENSTSKSGKSNITYEGLVSQSSYVGKGVSAFNKFKQIDGQQSRTTSGPQAAGPLFTLSTSLNRSASGVKDMIMTWCQCRTRNYKGVKIENFSTSWNDGLAFCALIHHFYPDAFNFDSLNPQNRRYNFALAFRTADERADVYPLLDVEDMVVMKKPDWKCVFTYVQTLYKRLKDE